MARPLDELNKELLSLPRKERADLALRLIRSLDEGVEEDVDAYWKEELVRRSRQIDSGEVEMIPAEEVFRKVNERLAKNKNQ
ncbi:MAG: addiction module protein [Pseudomonadota bacterium]